jgi:hypothetical protein
VKMLSTRFLHCKSSIFFSMFKLDIDLLSYLFIDGSCYVAQASLELNPPACTSQILNMVAHVCNHSTCEVEAEGLS